MEQTFYQAFMGASRRVGAGILAVVLLVIIFVGARAESSTAASPGPGITFGQIGHIGAYRLSSGELAYCLEAGVLEPWGAQLSGSVVTSLPSFTGSQGAGWQFGFEGTLNMPAVNDPARMRQMNYVIDTWGNTSNNEQAAATQLAVFQLRGDQSNFVTRMIASIREHGGSHVVERAASMVASARAEAVPAIASTAPTPLEIELDTGGVGTVTYGEGTTKLELTNAVFSDTNESVMQISAATAGVLNITGVTPSGWDRSYEVSVQGDWKSGREGWQGALRVHGPMATGQQRIATAVGATAGNIRTEILEAQKTVSNSWWPKITTRVSERIVAPGQHFIDTVTLEADPLGGFWSTNEEGDFMPIHAKGTLFGPFDRDPSLQSADIPPEDAPVAATAELLADRGPGVYEVRTDERAFSAGYYNWVWRVDWSDQRSEVTAPVRTGESSLSQNKLPVSDRFGETTETHTVAQRITIVTRLMEQQIGRGWSLTDEVAVTRERQGGWIRDEEGDIIPVTLQGRVYHSEEQPEQSEMPPENATEIARTTATVQGPKIISSEPVPIPMHLTGYVTIQWCVSDSNQPEHLKGLTREWCDDYGVPAETAQIETPAVTTKAQPKATVNDEITDVAVIEGLVPHKSSLDFVAYLLPEAGQKKFDSNWEPSVSAVSDHNKAETWSQEEIDELGQQSCAAQPVAITERVDVAHPGEIRSPVVKAKSTGTIYWVERLFAVDPISGEEHLLHEGECGLPNETTVIHSAERQVTPKTAETLAETGSATGIATVAGVGAVMMLMGGVAIIVYARKKCVDYNGLSRSCSSDS